MTKIVVTTLAEYQTAFWLPVAQEFERLDLAPTLISFDDRSTELLRAARIETVSITETTRATPLGKAHEALARSGPANVNFWLGHERFAFCRADDDGMRAKLGYAILCAEQALDKAGPDAVMLQELGGFLSVIGSFFAARARRADNLFIEPSFFRGRFLLTPNSFGAPAPGPGTGAPDPACDAYLDQTLAAGAIVVPQKDRHHYSAAAKKVFNLKNARRLAEKAADKYLFGKRQEFGHLGVHVRQHLAMLSNSRKLRQSYTPLEELNSFLYYPFHVPGDVALTLRAPEYLDQIALVDYLCRTAPDGVRIAVKEHPAMIGALDADRLLDLARRFPKLAILDPATNNYQVLRAADAIVTVNSKSGAEAGLLGKPVLVLGDAFYRSAPFAQAVDGLAALAPVLEKRAFAVESAQEGATRTWFQSIWRDTIPGELYHVDPANIRLFAAGIAARLKRLG